MPLLAVLRTISKCTSLLRYGDSLNSSQRYLIRTREGLLKRTKSPFHQHFGASKQTSDHNLKVNIGRNRILYGRVANLHVNKARNMASESGGSGLHDSQKENDDISLPFWIFLWSFLAIVAGFIYSKLNRQKEIESAQKSGVKLDVNDEQIARKLVKEIARKDSGKKPIFRRQRSYEIIDGEVRIHYDVSMLEDALNKSASVEGFLKTAEVESIPIRSASLEDLEFVYPGKLPSIVEEGDEDLEDQSEGKTPLNAGRPDAQMNFDKTKGKETKKTTKKIQNISNSNENTCNVEEKRSHFEKKQNEFPTSFETITQETLIPTESINDEGKITINPQKGNCVALKHEAEAELKEIKNATSLNENSDEDASSSISGDSVIENVSEISDVTNSLHNSNTTTTSVYKLSQVERTQEHKFTVTRREITKLKSTKENCPNFNSFNDETSFPVVKTKGGHKTGENGDDCSQLSRDLQSDKFDQEKFPRDEEVVKEVPSGSANEVIVKLSEDKVNECSATSFPEEPRALTFLEESNILVDKSGDILFKVIGPSTEDADFEVENEEQICEDDTSDEVAMDVNQNVDRFGGKNDLAKNWNSLPSWEGAHATKHRELNSDRSDVGYIDLDSNIVDDTDEDSSGVDQAQSLQDKNDDLKQKNLDIVSDEFEMRKGEVFHEDIKEAHLLTFDNKIGSRKTIFVKDVTTKPGNSENGERVESFIEKTGLDGTTDENTPTFGELDNENITGEIIVGVQTHEADPALEEPVFATASVAEEHVLMAKIITDSEPSEVKIDMSEPSGKTQTTAVRTTQTEIQSTQMKVCSIVKKFEEAREPDTSIQAQNGGANSDSDETAMLKNSNEQTDEDIESERQAVESSISQESALVDHDQISEYPIVSTTLDEIEKGKLSDNNADDSQISELLLIPDFVIEAKRHRDTDRLDLVENIPANVASIDKLESQPCAVEIKDDEEFVIYANQVSEVNASDNKNCETVEAIHASPVDDDYSPIVVYASQEDKSESTPESFCKEKSTQPNASSSCGLDKRINTSTTVVYADVSSNNTKKTAVIYANQDSDVEVVPQSILEPTNQSQTKNITPSHVTEEENISTQETVDMDLLKPTPNDEKRNFRETTFDATPLTSSPVINTGSSNIEKSNLTNVKITLSTVSDPLTNNSLHDIKEPFTSDKIPSHAINDSVTDQNPPEVQENILSSDIIPSLSSPLREVHDSPSSLWQNLPRGETDVDNLSDIDEIDIDILPDKNYQKSKSVTDLDEALASFGSLGYLSNDALDSDNATGSLSKSVPDILDSCREESLRETVGNVAEKLQKKNLSWSTPEINSKPGSKKVTKIKIVHVKFLEVESDSENVEEDSFIYDGDLPITGKMKRRSRNLSEEFSSPVATPPFYSPAASPPPGLSKEIAEERWIADKTNLKQLEFEFGDLFQNSPSPPALEANDMTNESSTDGLNRGERRETHEDTVKFQDASMAYSLPNNLSYKTTDKPLNASNNSTLEYQDPYPPDSSEKPSLTDINKQSFQSFNRGTTSSTSRFEKQSRRPRPREKTGSTVTYKTSNTTQSSTCITSESKSKSYNGRSSEDVIPALPSETKITSSTEKLHQNSNIIHSRTTLSSNTKTKVDYKNIQGNLSLTPQTARNEDISSRHSERISQSSTRTESYRYTPGNSHSYSKAPKPSPEHGKYIIKTATIASQSSSKETGYIAPQTRHTDNSPKNTAQFTERPISARHTTTQVRYIDSPPSAASSSSPQRGIKFSEKFRMSDEGNLAEKAPGDDRMSANDPRDAQKTRKANQEGSNDKGTSRHGGRLVTVKGGIISDYECSSDADSEMSYNAPSPRIKAKRFHRPQVYRVDSVSSSEPDSPRREVKSERRSMTELFGVDAGYQNSSDTNREMGSQNSLRNQTIFAKFGDVGVGEGSLRQDESFVPSNPKSSYVYQAKPTVFDPRPLQSGTRKQKAQNRSPHYYPERHPGSPNVYQAKVTAFDDQRFSDSKPYSNRRHTNTLERNLSPTSFLHEGNLDSGDNMSPKTVEFNPFEGIEVRDSFQPFERCHSPSSVFSDTSSVFSFNCDFDPMPPPTGNYEPEVYTCENPMCKKQDILLGPEKTNFKSCPACFTFYCSSECRKLHWPSHKQSCYFGRVNTYVRSIIRLCQRREDLSMYLSQLARDGYQKKGRGVVMAIFNSPELAREFITKGHDAFSGRKPTYSSLTELHREGIISKHRVALMQAVRDYEPNQELVFNIAVVASNNIPMVPAPRYKLNTVLHCIKMPLNDLIVARQPRDYEKVETRLFALPKCSRHEFVNEMEARRHYCRNLSKNLRQYNVKLKEDYPECYRKLCMYVEHNISFEPMTVYGQRGGLSYRCVIAPEQSYPLNPEYC